MNHVATALWVILTAFFVEEFVLIKPIFAIGESDPATRRLERAAIWVPAITIGVAVATLKFHGRITLGGTVNALGFLLCVAALGLRYWSRRGLGRYFTIGVIKQEGHVIVQSGPYRFVRHPGYLAFIVFYLGLALLMGSWLALVFLFIPSSLLFVCLSRVEDKRLAEEIGDEYLNYSKGRAALIPGLW